MAEPMVGSDDGAYRQGPVGLLLGAGGVRGCAHAGVLSVMERAGISADIVVGASIGSIFGAAYAAGWRADELRRLTDLAPRRTVAEFYLHRLRIDRKTYIGSVLSELGAATRIEDLPRKFACMALDCGTGKVVALTSGPLLQAVEASIALPGVARPVVIEDRTYLDGGLRGPISADVARRLGASHIIRVELIGPSPVRMALRRALRLRPSDLLTRARRLDPDRERPANLLGSVFTEADIKVAPEFFGWLCNAPLGIGFCAKRGTIAAANAFAAFHGFPMCAVAETAGDLKAAD